MSNMHATRRSNSTSSQVASDARAAKHSVRHGTLAVSRPFFLCCYSAVGAFSIRTGVSTKALVFFFTARVFSTLTMTISLNPIRTPRVITKDTESVSPPYFELSAHSSAGGIQFVKNCIILRGMFLYLSQSPKFKRHF